jgi:GT2 family glycosyltransferase
MPDFELSVTVCSWNTLEDLRRCLASLRAASEEANFEVIVVDNASRDGSAEMVATEFPDVTLVRSPVNLGFTGGHNLALKARKGRHAALFNSDTVVHPGAMGSLVSVLRNRPDVGIVAPKLLNPDGTLQYSCRRFPNPVAAAFRNTFLGRWFPDNRLVRDYLMQDFDHESPKEVDWVSGAALVVRGEALDHVGMLDEGYFMYCEDVDLCKRVWDAGYKVLYWPEAVVTHAIGRSTDQAANAMIVRFHRSMFRYYRKHLVPKAPFLLRPLLTALAGSALSLRAGLFLSKNGIDALRRRWSRK